MADTTRTDPAKAEGSKADPTRATVLGLGEAGTAFASGLAAAGFDVRAFDPRGRPTPPGVTRCDDPCAAVRDSDAVLALTAATDAHRALAQALDALPRDVLYVDLATTSPAHKRELAATANTRGIRFVDAALLGPVPEEGLATPQLAAGTAAPSYASLLAPAGGRVSVVGPVVGDAATRKLLRSIVMKGFTAALIEALRAGQATGTSRWLWEHLTDAGPFPVSLLRRLLEGTEVHATRRCDEMRAAIELLETLGVDPQVASATLHTLTEVDEHGLGDLLPLSRSQQSPRVQSS